jgi:cyclopropane fatty-acyl-phospholipid synthase-like methyltransferase
MLKNLFAVADNVLIVDHVVKYVPETFWDTWMMHVFSTEELAKKVTNSGYKIQHIQNLGDAFIRPTADYWKERLDQLQPQYGQLRTLWLQDVPRMYETAKIPSRTERCVIYASKNL